MNKNDDKQYSNKNKNDLCKQARVSIEDACVSRVTSALIAASWTRLSRRGEVSAHTSYCSFECACSLVSLVCFSAWVQFSLGGAQSAHCTLGVCSSRCNKQKHTFVGDVWTGCICWTEAGWRGCMGWAGPRVKAVPNRGTRSCSQLSTIILHNVRDRSLGSYQLSIE